MLFQNDKLFWDTDTTNTTDKNGFLFFYCTDCIRKRKAQIKTNYKTKNQQFNFLLFRKNQSFFRKFNTRFQIFDIHWNLNPSKKITYG